MPTISLRPTARAAASALAVLVLVLAAGCASADAGTAAEMAPAPSEPAAAAPAPAQEGQSAPQGPAGEKPPAGEPPMTGAEAAAVLGAGQDDSAGRGLGVYRPPQRKVELPPGAEWLTDEEGYRYYLKEIPKSEPWQWFTETHVRVRTSEIYELAEETEDALVVKIYEQARGVPSTQRRDPTPEEIAAVTESYRAQAPDSDRLRFRPFSAGLPESGQWRNGFGIGDMNGDGHLDIVHGPARKGRYAAPVVFLGDGAGNWTVWREASFPSLGYSYGDAAVADFNGDGHLDVALGQHILGVTVMIGDGKGKFVPWSKGLPWEQPGGGSAALGFSSRQVEAGDWNGDGRIDLLALGEGPRPAREGPYKAMGILPSSSFGVAVFLNQGDGTWRRLDQGMKFGQLFGDHLAVGDYDGDGRLDFATSSNSFGRKDLVGLSGPDGEWTHVEVEPVRARSYVRAVASADFDGDGRLDLAVSTVSNQVERWFTAVDVLLAREDGWTRRTLHGAEGRHWASALAAGDLDGDGHADLVATTLEGATWIFLGKGDGSFTREQSDEVADMAGGCTGYGLALADLDGDGRDEFVAGFAGEPSAMFAPDRCPTLGALRAWDAEPPAERTAADRGGAGR